MTGEQLDLFPTEVVDPLRPGARNCGACAHCDPEPIEKAPGRRPVSYCRARCTFVVWETPRGEPWAAEYACKRWVCRMTPSTPLLNESEAA